MAQPRRILPYGPNAVLIECADSADVIALAGFAREMFGEELVEVIPAAVTLTLVGHQPLRPEAVESIAHARLAGSVPGDRLVTPADSTAPVPSIAEASSRIHLIEVTYDGEDLHWVADRVGLTIAEVIQAHTARPWTVAFCGFTPGFGYLTRTTQSVPHPLDVPRLDRPRPSVPAGSVALAGLWSAVYPRASPGGWRLIGRTDARMWDSTAAVPALLQPGDQVHFQDITP